MNQQVILFDEDRARSAYLAYLGVLAHEKLDPTLADNPAWGEIKRFACDLYTQSYEVAA
jgi:hypothetical protein